MKTATLPSIRVEPEFREAIEASLAEGESLSEFIESTLRDGLRRRTDQAAFLARGRAAAQEWRRTGVSSSAEEVLSELRQMLERARAQKKAQAQARPPAERER